MPSSSNVRTPMAARDLLFFDIETSGLDSDRHEILNLAAVRVSPDFSRVIGRMDRLCRLERPHDAETEALAKNGYNAPEWREALPVRVALVEFGELMKPIDDVLIVGHNAARFDWPFIREGFKREKLALPDVKYVLDTASIAWPLVTRGIVDSISLATLCTAYGISNVGAHRAMADVRRTMRVYCKLCGMAEPRGIL